MFIRSTRPLLGRATATVGLILSALTLTPAAQTTPLARPERFSALAIPPRADFSPVQVDLVVTRWSTDQEHDRLITTLTEAGSKAFEKVLMELPRVGSFGTVGMAGIPVRYARKWKSDDGRERISMATDRWVGFAEAINQSRTLDYPVTWIQIVLKPSGEGEGSIALAAKIGIDRPTKLIVVENYDIAPIKLNAVRRLK
jgi:hypothetical protein